MVVVVVVVVGGRVPVGVDLAVSGAILEVGDCSPAVTGALQIRAEAETRKLPGGSKKKKPKIMNQKRNPKQQSTPICLGRVWLNLGCTQVSVPDITHAGNQLPKLWGCAFDCDKMMC